jgi:hypothetical protein
LPTDIARENLSGGVNGSRGMVSKSTVGQGPNDAVNAVFDDVRTRFPKSLAPMTIAVEMQLRHAGI